MVRIALCILLPVLRAVCSTLGREKVTAIEALITFLDLVEHIAL